MKSVLLLSLCYFYPHPPLTFTYETVIVVSSYKTAVKILPLFIFLIINLFMFFFLFFQECAEWLKEASIILQRESPLLDEYHLGMQAESELNNLTAVISKLG